MRGSTAEASGAGAYPGGGVARGGIRPALHGEAALPEVGDAQVEVAGPVPGGDEHLHRLAGERAEGPAAVGDDLPVPGHLGEPAVELRQRDGARAREMGLPVLLLGAHVEQGHVAAADARQQRLPLRRLEGPELVAEPVHLRQQRLGEAPQHPEGPRHAVVGDPVADVAPLARGGDHPRRAHLLEVPGRVRHRDPRRRGEVLHAA